MNLESGWPLLHPDPSRLSEFAQEESEPTSFGCDMTSILPANLDIKERKTVHTEVAKEDRPTSCRSLKRDNKAKNSLSPSPFLTLTPASAFIPSVASSEAGSSDHGAEKIERRRSGRLNHPIRIYLG